MANQPTIVVANLDDAKLKASIDRMVNDLNAGLNKMTANADAAVRKMQASLQSLGDVKFNSGGSDGGSSRRTRKQQEEAEAVKQAADAYDKLAQSMEKTGSRKKGIEYLSLTSDVDKDVTYLINLNKDVDAQMASIIQKEQVLLEKKQEELRLSQQISQEQQRAQNSVGAKDLGINPNISAGRERQLNTTIAMEQHVSNLRSQLASLLEVEERDVKMVNSQKASYNELTVYIKHLQAAYQRLGGDIAKGEGKDIAAEFQKATRAAQLLQNQLNRPVDLKSAMGLSEKTLDDIAYKMRMLSNYRSGLDYSTQRGEIAMVNAEYNKLQKRMNDVIGKNEQLIKTNNALTRSFNYMKNRLAFYFTVGASTQFVKQLIEVRSQYEMNERALGILINSAERGTKIFNELSQMALVSPYTLIELSAAAKQLTAYDVAAKDVVDTTRRLADMAAAVGIPIERLTYALGQIKAYGYLNARDARMFANAGIPLIKQLADYYTELEGHLVSTADIYDRIKKKSIGYEEVMQVMTKMTDEGGKFYDFQAKMAETLKVRLANLTLAWNNMLNDIGQTQQGLLTGSINTLKEVFIHWKDIEHVINGVVIAFGAYKAYQLIITSLMGTTANAIDRQVLAQKRNEVTMLRKQALVRQLTYEEKRLIASQNMLTSSDYANALSGKQLTKQKALLLVALNANNVQLKAAIANMGILTAEEMANINVGKALAIVFKSIGISIASVAKSIGAFLVSNWWLIAIAGLYELYHAWDSYTEHVEELNKTAAEQAKDAWKNVKDYMESDVSVNLRQRVTASPDSLDDIEAQKAWDDMREKIELSSQAANTFIAKLMQIPNVNERIKAGFDYLEDLEKVAGVMQSMPEDAIQISSSILGGALGEGLKDDLDDFIESYKEYISLTKSQKESAYGESVFNEQKSDLEELRSEIKITTDSIYDFAAGQKFNSNQQREFFERMISESAQKEQMNAEQTRIYRMKAEEEYYQYASSKLKEQLQYQQGAQKAATEQRIRDLDAEFGTQKAMQQSFFEWVSERHASEVRKQFQNMTKEEISHIDWSQPKWKQWAEKLAKDFSNEYGVSFNDLHRLVLQANTWSVHIPVYFQTIGQPLSDVQRDYETRTGKKFKDNYLIKDAKSQVEIIDILKKKQKEQAEAIETARKAGGKYWEDNKKALEDENNALIADIHAYNALTDAEEKALKKGGKKGGSKKDLVLEALKQEIQLVEKLQSDYDKLAKSGASQPDALAAIRGAYGNTIKKLNTELGGYGLPTIDITKLIVGKDPNRSLEHFKNTLSSLIDKGMLTLERSKEVEAVIEKLTLSAKTYNLDMITKGLNNELGKLKDEYELAVELDANPELGSVFADMFGIDPSDFSHSIDDYMFKVQSAFEKARRELGYGVTIDVFKANDEEWKEWGKWVGLSGEALDNFKARFVGARDVAKKWATDVVNNTKKLEYELAEIDDKIAIKEKEQAQLHERIEKEKNEATKHYLELTYQNNEKAIDELRAQALSLMPEYARVFNSIAEYSAGVSRRLQRDLMRVFDEAKYDSANKKWTLTGSDGKQTILNDTQYRKEREKLTREMRKSQAPFKKIKEAFKPSDKNGVVDYAKGIELVSAEVQKLGSVASEIGNLAQIFGADEQTVEIINDVATSLNGVATAGQGIAQIASGDYIGGAVSVLSGITSVIGAWADNGNKKIDAEIKESELAVKRLELAYIDLEHAMDEAYGTAEIGAQRAIIVNKELQLAELKRQLQLEQSRKAKYRDEDRILELRKQIRELEYDIVDSINGITNSLLGISSVGNAAETLVTNMIAAFKKGEDFMAEYAQTFDDMIDNMIMKAIVSNVIGNRLQEMFDRIQQTARERAKKEEEAYASAYKEFESSSKWADKLGEYAEFYNFDPYADKVFGDKNKKITREQWEALWQERLEYLKKQYEEAMTPTPDDVQSVKDDVKNWRDSVKEEFMAYMDAFGIKYGQDSTKQLSALQQGISGVTETTAQAVEAYLNGMSQQAYLRNDLLTQIRDIVVGFDLDIQLGVMSQMLLQLQNSYILMQSMAAMMDNWTVPAGNGIRVELIS